MQGISTARRGAPKKGTDLLGVGDVLDEALYGRPPGGGEAVLLLAAGQRIETAVQLRRLQEAGFRVDLQAGAASPGPSGKDTGSAAQTSGATASLCGAIDERIAASARVRHSIHEAARELLGSVRAGGAPDMAALKAVGHALVTEVSQHANTIAALTHLRRCDDYTVEHSADVAILMVAIGHVQGLPQTELDVLALAGLMHDVGKQRVPLPILKKPGRPTREEFEVLRRHPEHGYAILSACPDLPEAVPLVTFQHHERIDGSGYPQGLVGPAIHPYSQIAAVADCFDAMTSDRPYHKGCAPRQALLELYGLAGRRLEDRAVQALIKLVGVYPVGTRVVLDTGERGVVIDPNPEDATRPTILIDQDCRGCPLPHPYALALQSASCRIAAAGP